MKVLLINGSCRKNSNTAIALEKCERVLENNGIDYERITIPDEPIRDCSGCGACAKMGKNRCVHDDDIVNRIIEKAEGCDGFIFGTPVYYAHPSGRILSVLDRVFYSGGKVFAFKPAFSIAVARRAGTTASFDVMNKYFTICQMPVVSSTYWNVAHGAKGGEIEEDKEGIQTIINATNNLVCLLKCIKEGEKNGITPPVNERARTNFIR